MYIKKNNKYIVRVEKYLNLGTWIAQNNDQTIEIRTVQEGRLLKIVYP